MCEYTVHPIVAMNLIDREVRRLRQQIKKYEDREVVVFAAGEYGRRFSERLSENFGVDAAFFIDNDPQKAETVASGKPVLLRPWKNDPDFVQKYFVLIATSRRGVAQISAQLDKVGVPHMASDAYEATLLSERAKKILQLLDDDFSKASYLGLMWYWLTHDSSLCQTSDHQYFAPRPFMVPTGIVVDLGAFVGDTVEEYVRRGLGGSKIYAFEPDERNRLTLSRRIKRLQSEWNLGDEQVSIIAAGVGTETGILRFHHDEQKNRASALSQQGEKEVQVYALDDFFEEKRPPTLIKADIEGAEQDMLRGAAGLIQKYKPKMALAMYHFADDFVRMPEMIYCMNSAYSFAVRTHSTGHGTVLYCY